MKYELQIDGKIIMEFTVPDREVSSPWAINKLKNKLAEDMMISVHGMELIPKQRGYIYYTDMKTGKTMKKFLTKEEENNA